MFPGSDVAQEQTPAPGELTLDHVAYFVPHIDAASEALEQLGFLLTPFSVQSHRLEPGGPVVPAGTGNRCVMLERGYIEVLTPIGETSVATQLRAAIKRYSGLHSLIFGTNAPDADHERLARAGFAPLPPIALQREIATERDIGTARFTVVRTPPGTMPEGRIQFCQQHTPELLWQERWVAHPNRAIALTGAIVCVDDPGEVAQRYTRFTGLLAQGTGPGTWRITTARGSLLFVDEATLARGFAVTPPSRPWIAGCTIASGDIAATASHLRGSGVRVEDAGGRRLLARVPAHLGGFMVFEPGNSGPPALE